MVFQLGSIREKYANSDYTVSTTTGGSITDGTSGFLYISGWNRTGRNKLSDAVSFTVTAPNNKIEITLNSSIRGSGEDLFKIVISYAPTNTPTQAKQILSWSAKDTDQETLISLPVTLEVTTNDQLDTSSVSTVGELPTGRNKGHILFVVGEGNYYEYDGVAWNVTDFNGLNYIATTTILGGCDYGLAGIPNVYTVSTPAKGVNTDSTKVNYWLLNKLTEGAGTVLTSSYAVKVLVFVGGVDKSEAFSEKVKVNLKGYTRRLTGEFISGVTTSTVTWVYGQPIYLPTDLQTGHAASFDVWLSFDENELASTIIEGESVTIKLDAYTSKAIPSLSSELFGDGVYSSGNKLRIVPNVRLDGTGSWKRFDVVQDVTAPVIGLLNNTPNQLVCLDSASKGGVIVRQSVGDLKGTEVIRATVSTESGESKVSPKSNTVTLTGSESLAIEVTHPVTSGLWQVRNDYPDVIAGFAECPQGPIAMKVYVDVDGTLYEHDGVYLVGSSPSQTITLTDLSGATVVGSLPTIATDYSLYAQDTAPTVTTLGGSLAAGDYAVYVAYLYEDSDGVMTKIDHSTGITEITEPIFDTINNAENILNVKTTVAFTQPAIDSNVTVSVNTLSYILPESYVFITGGGHYQVVSIDTGLNQMVVKNLGGSNAAPSTVIPVNSRIAASGAKGEAGVGLEFPLLPEETSLDNATDYLVFYDNSASENKKILVENLETGVDFDTIAEDTTIDQSNDYLLFRDSSATEDKKILPINLGISGTVTSAVPYGANLRLTFENGLRADIAATLSSPDDIYIVFEETDGSTTSSNLGINGTAITCTNGAAITTTQSFEGLTSLECLNDNDYATLTMSTGLDLTREYEMTLVFYPTTNDTSGGEIHSFISTHTSGFLNGFYFGYLTNTCLFRILDSGGAVAFGHIFGPTYFTLNEWHTIKLTRTETSPSVFTMVLTADGVEVKNEVNGNTQPTTTTNLTLGNNIGNLALYGARGYVDSFKFKYTDI